MKSEYPEDSPACSLPRCKRPRTMQFYSYPICDACWFKYTYQELKKKLDIKENPSDEK